MTTALRQPTLSSQCLAEFLGTALLIFDIVAGTPAGVVAGSAVLALGAVAWFLFPALHRIRTRQRL